MPVIKKNLTSIIMGVLVLLAVVGVYVWPIPKLYVSLTAELQKSVSMGRDISSQLTTRTVPNLSADPVDTPKTLDGFPNESAITATQKAAENFKQQADKVFQAAAKVNADAHPLLVDNSLPKPQDPDRYSYQKKYGEETAGYIRWMKTLNFTARPTPDVIQQAKDALKAKINQTLLVPNGQGGFTEQSQHEADHEYSIQVDKVEGALDQTDAEQHSIYLEDKALAGVDPKLGQIAAGQALPAPEKIFDTQLALWCIDDFAKAVGQCNAKFADVDPKTGKPINDIIHNPIKQIETLGPPLPTIVGDPSATVMKQVTASMSARACNSTYDVAAYTVRLVIDGDKVPLVIRELQAGQFLTILRVQIYQAMDPALTAASGYRFGDKPCVEIELQVEELFLHQWTDLVLPDSRKKGFGGANNSNGQFQTDQGDPNASPTGP